MKYFLEIKNRIFIIFSSTTVLILLQLYVYKDTLLFLVLKPNINQKSNFYLICTSITEGFVSYWYIIWIIALHFLFFFFIINTFVYILPGLYKTEIKVFKFYLLLYLIFEVAFLLLFYNIILPYSWSFFYKVLPSSFSHNVTVGLFFEVKINEYLNYFFTLYFICLMMSQIFSVISIKLNMVYKQSHFKRIKTYRKKLYFLFFIFSTIITPPDLISQIVLGLVLIVILELTLFLIILLNKF